MNERKRIAIQEHRDAIDVRRSVGKQLDAANHDLTVAENKRDGLQKRIAKLDAEVNNTSNEVRQSIEAEIIQEEEQRAKDIEKAKTEAGK